MRKTGPGYWQMFLCRTVGPQFNSRSPAISCTVFVECKLLSMGHLLLPQVRSPEEHFLRPQVRLIALVRTESCVLVTSDRGQGEGVC